MCKYDLRPLRQRPILTRPHSRAGARRLLYFLLVVLRLLPALAFLACVLAPVAAQPTGRDGASHETGGDVQVGYLLTSDLFARPSVLATSAGPLSRDDRVRVVRYPERRGWFEVYSMDGARLLGYAYQPYVSRFGPDGPEVPPVSDTSVAAAAGDDGRRPVSVPVPAPPGRQLPEVAFSESHASGVRCAVRLWTNVRRGPGLGYEAFGVIRPDVPFQVHTMEDGWGRVQLAEREAGWVSHVLLDCTPAAVTPASLVPLPIGAVAFPHSGELALSTSPHAPTAARASADVEPTVDRTSQQSALSALLIAAGIDPARTVYVSPADGRFHRPACPHLPTESHPLSLAEAMMDHPPCAHCVPLAPPSHGAPDDR